MLNYSKNFEKVAKENGYELTKELVYRCGYIYEYNLVKKDGTDKIFVGSANGINNGFSDEVTLIERMINGKSEEEESREDFLTEYAKFIEREMLA